MTAELKKTDWNQIVREHAIRARHSDTAHMTLDVNINIIQHNSNVDIYKDRKARGYEIPAWLEEYANENYH